MAHEDGDVMVRRARAYLARVEGAVSGQRGHDRTMRAAGILIQKFGLTIDSLRVIVVRPVSDTLADTSVFFNPDSSSLHLALPLLLKSAEETLTVSLILSAGGVPIFSDSRSMYAGRSSDPLSSQHSMMTTMRECGAFCAFTARMAEMAAKMA